MSGQYAKDTSVSTEASRAEIERTLQRYGAEAFAYGWTGDRAQIQFAANGRQIRFVLELPDKDDDEFRLTPGRGLERSEAQAYAAWEQACRQRWRALALVVKAKLEAVEAGISDFEDEFLSHILLPDGTTAGAWLRPQIAQAYETGRMPEMLPALGAGPTARRRRVREEVA
jgi:hypothetical protein